MELETMDNFREFLGRDLDDCIGQALHFYDCPREKLEVEIVQDAKSGIFGIVGARKAKIRARRAQLADTVASLLGESRKAAPENSEARKAGAQKTVNHSSKPGQAGDKKQFESRENPQPKPGGRKTKAEHVSPAEAPASSLTLQASSAKQEPERAVAPAVRHVENAIPPALETAGCEPADDDAETGTWPDRNIEELDKVVLEQKTLEIVGALLRPLADREIDMSMEIGQGGPRVQVDWTGDAGLLIGRDGQTLAAVQYLASRMLTRVMGASLHVQLDIGDYRAKQDDRLRELARRLAEKARQTGRPFSTRPLSSYHRRVIHVCLQEEPDVQTKSIGEGPQKRVLISPRRPCQP